MMLKKILFVTHKKKQCGVYEFGNNVFNVISKSKKYQVILSETESLQEYNDQVSRHQPDAVIYNYHPSTMPWLCTKIAPRLYKNNIAGNAYLQIGIIHEITQEVSDTATSYGKGFIMGGSSKLVNTLFDFYIAADPTLLLRNPIVYKTGRLIPAYHNRFSTPSTLTVGSFGFGTPNKGFEKIIATVQNEFDEAIIRLNIPAADFGDPKGENAVRIAENCRQLIHKKGISLQVTHDFMDNNQVLDFLAQNSINVFLYEDIRGRGLASAVDFALAVKRPLAVSDSIMFRHVTSAVPSANTKSNSLKQILAGGFGPYEAICEDWDGETILWEYERILDGTFHKHAHPQKNKMGIIRTVQSFFRRQLSLPDKSFTWLRDIEVACEDDLTVKSSLQYQSVELPVNATLNRILDDAARKIYKPAEEMLFKLAPATMSKKIPEANVQQAFVFDTVFRFMPSYSNPKMLCVGSFEDTAAMGLIKLGYKVEEIDPMLNYFLQEYVSKPSTKLNSYDIVFSTSVIEHDPDDASFVKCINDLLAPGGVAIITCDYKDGWKPGDLKPDVDARLYTKTDLESRLLKLMPDCSLVDVPEWDCPNPDFLFLGKYRYTFATFVVKKKS